MSQLIQAILNAEDDNLVFLLHMSSKKWTFSRADLFHWTAVLDKFDAFMEEMVTRYALNEIQRKDFVASEKALLVEVLLFTKVLAENCINKSIYNSYDRLEALLYASDLQVVEAVLRLLAFFSAKFGGRSLSKNNAYAVNQKKIRVLAHMEPQSTKSVVSVDYVHMCQPLEPDHVMHTWGHAFHYQFYRQSTEVVPASGTSPMEVDSPLPDASSSTAAASQSQPKRERAAAGLVMVKKPRLFAAEAPSAAALLDEMVAAYVVPPDCHFALFHRLRVHKEVASFGSRVALLNIKFLALAILAPIFEEDADAPFDLMTREPQILKQLAALSHPEKPVPSGVRATAVHLLEVLARHRAKIADVLAAINFTTYHGVMSSFLRTTAEHADTDVYAVHSADYVDGLFSLMTFVVSTQNGGSAIVSSGIIPAIIRLVERNASFDANSRVCTRCIELIDTILYSFPNVFSQFQAAEGIATTVAEIARIAAHAAAGAYSATDLTEAEASDAEANAEDAGSLALDVRLYVRALLKFILHLMQSAGTVDGMRNLIETALPTALATFFENVSLFGAAVYAQATAIVSTFVNNEPTTLAILLEMHVPHALVRSLEARVPASADVISAVPHALGALCLTAAGMELVESSRVCEQLFSIFVQRDFLRVLQETDAPAALGAAIDEFVRHHPSTRDRIFRAIIGVFDTITALYVTAAEDLLNCSLLLGAAEESAEVSVAPAASFPKSEGREALVPQLIEVFCVFLEAFLTADAHKQTFVEAGGALRLLQLYDLPTLPYDFSASICSFSLFHLVKALVDFRPADMLNLLLERVALHLHPLEGFVAYNGSPSFFLPAVAMRDASEARRFNEFRAHLLPVHGIVSLLSDIYASKSVAFRLNAPLLASLRLAAHRHTFERLWALYGACTWEFHRFKRALPAAWLAKARRDSPSNVAELDAATNSTLIADPHDRRIRNMRCIKFFLTQIPTAFIPLTCKVAEAVGERGAFGAAVGAAAVRERDTETIALLVDCLQAALRWTRVDLQTEDAASANLTSLSNEHSPDPEKSTNEVQIDEPFKMEHQEDLPPKNHKLVECETHLEYITVLMGHTLVLFFEEPQSSLDFGVGAINVAALEGFVFADGLATIDATLQCVLEAYDAVDEKAAQGALGAVIACVAKFVEIDLLKNLEFIHARDSDFIMRLREKGMEMMMRVWDAGLLPRLPAPLQTLTLRALQNLLFVPTASNASTAGSVAAAAAASNSSQNADEAHVSRLVSIGISADAASTALAATGNNLTEAIIFIATNAELYPASSSFHALKVRFFADFTRRFRPFVDAAPLAEAVLPAIGELLKTVFAAEDRATQLLPFLLETPCLQNRLRLLSLAFADRKIFARSDAETAILQTLRSVHTNSDATATPEAHVLTLQIVEAIVANARTLPFEAAADAAAFVEGSCEAAVAAADERISVALVRCLVQLLERFGESLVPFARFVHRVKGLVRDGPTAAALHPLFVAACHICVSSDAADAYLMRAVIEDDRMHGNGAATVARLHPFLAHFDFCMRHNPPVFCRLAQKRFGRKSIDDESHEDASKGYCCCCRQNSQKTKLSFAAVAQNRSTLLEAMLEALLIEENAAAAAAKTPNSFLQRFFLATSVEMFLAYEHFSLLLQAHSSFRSFIAILLKRYVPLQNVFVGAAAADENEKSVVTQSHLANFLLVTMLSDSGVPFDAENPNDQPTAEERQVNTKNASSFSEPPIENPDAQMQEAAASSASSFESTAHKLAAFKRTILETFVRHFREAAFAPVHAGAPFPTLKTKYGALQAFVDLLHKFLVTKIDKKTASRNIVANAAFFAERKVPLLCVQLLNDIDVHYPRIDVMTNALMRCIELLTRITNKVAHLKDSRAARAAAASTKGKGTSRDSSHDPLNGAESDGEILGSALNEDDGVLSSGCSSNSSQSAAASGLLDESDDGCDNSTAASSEADYDSETSAFDDDEDDEEDDAYDDDFYASDYEDVSDASDEETDGSEDGDGDSEIVIRPHALHSDAPYDWEAASGSDNLIHAMHVDEAPTSAGGGPPHRHRRNARFAAALGDAEVDIVIEERTDDGFEEDHVHTHAHDAFADDDDDDEENAHSGESDFDDDDDDEDFVVWEDADYAADFDAVDASRVRPSWRIDTSASLGGGGGIVANADFRNENVVSFAFRPPPSLLSRGGALGAAAAMRNSTAAAPLAPYAPLAIPALGVNPPPLPAAAATGGAHFPGATSATNAAAESLLLGAGRRPTFLQIVRNGHAAAAAAAASMGTGNLNSTALSAASAQPPASQLLDALLSDIRGTRRTAFDSTAAAPSSSTGASAAVTGDVLANVGAFSIYFPPTRWIQLNRILGDWCADSLRLHGEEVVRVAEAAAAVSSDSSSGSESSPSGREAAAASSSSSEDEEEVPFEPHDGDGASPSIEQPQPVFVDAGIDVSFLEAIPVDLRHEVLQQHFADRRVAAPPHASIRIDDAFLQSLSPGLRAAYEAESARDIAIHEAGRGSAAHSALSAFMQNVFGGGGGRSGADLSAFGSLLQAAAADSRHLHGDDRHSGDDDDDEEDAFSDDPHSGDDENGNRADLAADAEVRRKMRPRAPIFRSLPAHVDAAALQSLLRLWFTSGPRFKKSLLFGVVRNAAENVAVAHDFVDWLLVALQSLIGGSFEKVFPATPSGNSAGLSAATSPPRVRHDLLPASSVLVARTLELLGALCAHNALIVRRLCEEAPRTTFVLAPIHEAAASRKRRKSSPKVRRTRIPLVLLLHLFAAADADDAVAAVFAAFLAKLTAAAVELHENEVVLPTPSTASTAAAPFDAEASLVGHLAVLPQLPAPVVHRFVDAAVVQHSGASSAAAKATASVLKNVARFPGVQRAILTELFRVAHVAFLDRVVEDLTLRSRDSEHLSDPQGSVCRFHAIFRIVDTFYEEECASMRPASSSVIPAAPKEAQPSSLEAFVPQLAAFDVVWLRLNTLLVELAAAADVHDADAATTEASANAVATALQPLIEALFLAAKWRRHGTAVSADANDDDFLARFIEAHKKVLNYLVKASPSLLSNAFGVLLADHSKMLDFDNKRTFFRAQLKKAAGNVFTLNLTVRRQFIFEDAFQKVMGHSGADFRNAKLNIKFYQEDGVDAGGVTREFYSELARQIFNPNYALFKSSALDRITFQPNRASWVNPDHLQYFKFVGRIIGKAVHDGRLLDCYFTRSFYKHILGIPVDYRDMEAVDIEIYKSFVWMLDNSINGVLELTFSTDIDDFGTTRIVDLIPEGRNIAVTDDNKVEYVRLMSELKLTTAISAQIAAFTAGFQDVIPASLMRIFNEQELELLISGMPAIDVDDWRNNTVYEGYTQGSPQIQWFWRAVRSFDVEERAKLLQFCTGTSKVPLEGFAALQGSNGLQKFQIHKDFGRTDRLPCAHTCFNQLDIPVYESYDVLRHNILLAINECSTGFGLA